MRIPEIVQAKYARAETLYLLGWVDFSVVKAGELAALIALELGLMDRFGGRISKNKRSFAAILRYMVEVDGLTERTIRPIALNRKNALFAGHDAGAENWATIASLIETCKLNSVDPFAYLTATLTVIVNGHKQSRIDELLPWKYAAT